MPHVRAATIARFNFEYALTDVSILLENHDSQTRRERGRPDRDLEVFKRAGIILVVTAWEAYIEDTLTVQFTKRLKSANTPQDMENTFNAVAQAWLGLSDMHVPKPKPPDLARWADKGWKEVIREKFSKDIEGLNTPNPENVRALSKRYLDFDITKSWRWQRVSSSTACNKLDQLIRLRGDLVHRGKDMFEEKTVVHRNQVIEAKSLVEHLVECTDIALDVAPTEGELAEAFRNKERPTTTDKNISL